MLDVLNMVGVVVFVVFFFGFCVFIHELGHFLVAKWCGLHINAFSIGFKKAWGKTINGVDYRIGWLPFGGYVDLPQVDATGSDIKDQDGNPLPAAKPIHRILTAFAGPFFNFLFGLALGVVIWKCGVPQGSPRLNHVKVGAIVESGPSYRAGLRTGDRIVKFNGDSIDTTWQGFLNDFIMNVGEVTLSVERDGKEFDISYQPEINPENPVSVSEEIYFPCFEVDTPVVVFPFPNSVAKAAGIQNGDIVKSVNGEPVKNKTHFVKTVSGTSSKKIDLEVIRNGETVSIPSFETAPMKQVKPYYMIGAQYNVLRLVVDGIKEGSHAYKIGLRSGDSVEKINGVEIGNTRQLELAIAPDKLKKTISLELQRNGEVVILNDIVIDSKEKGEGAQKVTIAYKREVEITSIVPDSPAEKAGLQPADLVVSVNGKAIEETNEFSASIVASNGLALELGLIRGGAATKLSVTPELTTQYGIGVDLSYINYPTPWQQFTKVVNDSYRTLSGVGAGIKNKLGFSEKKSSLKISNFSGPLGIVNIIWKVVYFGSYLRGLSIIVMITFSLGLLNLMPLPVLDGGHIVMAFIQMVIRRPLPAKIIEPLTMVFVVLLISFMLYVTAFDVKRIFGDDGVEETSTGTTLVLSTK